MRIPLPRGRFLVVHVLRVALLFSVVVAATWAVDAFKEPKPAVVIHTGLINPFGEFTNTNPQVVPLNVIEGLDSVQPTGG